MAPRRGGEKLPQTGPKRPGWTTVFGPPMSQQSSMRDRAVPPVLKGLARANPTSAPPAPGIAPNALLNVPHPHVEFSAELGGSPVIRGTRIAVRRLWAWHRQGLTPEVLMRRYPQLGPAQLYDALSFAYDNQRLIEVDGERERVALMNQSSK